jgi:hypothetical protein
VDVYAQQSTLSLATDSMDFNKRYRLDKKHVNIDSESNESNGNDDDLPMMIKRYRFDKRYRLDKKQVNNDGINKRYRFD